MSAYSDWPLAADFSSALQNPSWTFRDPELKQAQIECDVKSNRPRCRAGAFANVYKATLPGGSTRAVRVFTSAASERRERYQEIAAYLEKRRLNSLVIFTYDDKGIKSPKNGKAYPLMTMEWVEGKQLYDWVHEKCSNNDCKSLSHAADLWLTTIKELGTARIAHGDLQHGNVLVTAQGLKLVDYDTMCVPALVGRKNPEIGVDPYQHPARNQDTLLSPNLDKFSALFIYVVLRALAASPDLWTTYVANTNYDKLLFRHEDLHAPDNSALIRDLRRSPDQEVQRLTKELLNLMHIDIDRVPRLEDLRSSFTSIKSVLSQDNRDPSNSQLMQGKKPLREVSLPLRSEVRDAHSGAEEKAARRPSVQPKLIFISAKSEDYDHARAYYNYLKARGLEVFLSCESLSEMGISDYREVIDQKLDEARHMIVVTSSAKHVQSGWVKAEWGLFINEKRSDRKSGNLITVIAGGMPIEELPASLRYYEVIAAGPESFEKALRYVRD